MKQSEHEGKINLVRYYLKTNELEGILLSRRDSFAWLTCGGNDSVFQFTETGMVDILITAQEKFLIASEVEKYRLADEELNGLGFEVVGYDWYASREKVIADLTASKRIACDTYGLPFPNVFDSFRLLRYTLLDEEIIRFRELCRLTAIAVQTACLEIKQGESEFEIAANLSCKLLRHGIKTPVLMVAADDRIRKYRHPMPADRKVGKYALVVVGAEKHGLYASMSRMISFGEPSVEILKKQNACMEVDAEMIQSTIVGASVSNILRNGISRYAASGYPDEWKFHHQGGATGYHAREYIATFESAETVKNNQAFSWNPTIAGTKCEDTYLITEKGQEILTESCEWPVKTIDAKYGEIKRPDIMIR